MFAQPKFAGLFLLIASIGPLAAALVSQYGFGLHPCELCIWQRYPYVALILVAAVAWLKRNNAATLRVLLLMAAGLWLVEGALAFYHVGVEQSWWESATGCTTQGTAGQSLDDLRAAIVGSPLVSCAEPELVVLGLSMAGWNVVVSLACMVISLYFVKSLCFVKRMRTA